MLTKYAAHGVEFHYPEAWDVQEASEDGRFSVTVAPSETCFWSLVLLHDRPSPQEVLDSTLEAFAEFEDLDVYPAEGKLSFSPALARDLDFVCLDLVVSAFIRIVQRPTFTALVLYQGSELEIEDVLPYLEEIVRSVRLS